MFCYTIVIVKVGMAQLIEFSSANFWARVQISQTLIYEQSSVGMIKVLITIPRGNSELGSITETTIVVFGATGLHFPRNAEQDGQISLFFTIGKYGRSLLEVERDELSRLPLQTTMALLACFLKSRDVAPPFQPRGATSQLGDPSASGLVIPSLLGRSPRCSVAPSLGGTRKIPCLSAKCKQCYIPPIGRSSVIVRFDS